jgi:hypothetical protein
MLPDSDQPSPDCGENSFCSSTWTSLSWSPWVPFTAYKDEFRQIPKEPGLYRIRAVGNNPLMYIGETRRTLHLRLQDLRMEMLGSGERMPWAEPHTEAPALWAWQDAEGYEYECSAAPLDASANSRQGMETYLLYRYRQESGQSPACNFGRFHPRYRKSSGRKEHLRGGKLEDGQMNNPAGGPSYPALEVTGTPGEPGWMGLLWSQFESLTQEKIRAAPAGQGLFILIEADSKEIIFISHSAHCQNRLADLSRKPWEEKSLLFSFHGLAKTVLPHQIREMETDLIGNYFEQNQKAPEFQFRKGQ